VGATAALLLVAGCGDDTADVASSNGAEVTTTTTASDTTGETTDDELEATEHVRSIWAGAAIDVDGSGEVTEVIDYDFGDEAKRGIFREVPDLDPEAPITAESATAPDDLLVTADGGTTRIRVGDPDQTITGAHRYTIGYPLEVVDQRGAVYWNAIGAEWEVRIAGAEVHVTGPWRWRSVECVTGPQGSHDECDEVREVEPGHVVARVDELAPGEGVTIRAVRGRALDASPPLDPPSGPVGAT
jgi:hypothetical protein